MPLWIAANRLDQGGGPPYGSAMRKCLLPLVILSVAMATPGWAARFSPFRQAEQLIVAHRLLTPGQLACSTLVRGPDAIGEAIEVTVLEKHVAPCPGDPRVVVRRFDIFMDPLSGTVQWDGYGTMEMTDIPADIADPRPFCLPAGPCLHH